MTRFATVDGFERVELPDAVTQILGVEEHLSQRIVMTNDGAYIVAEAGDGTLYLEKLDDDAGDTEGELARYRK